MRTFLATLLGRRTEAIEHGRRGFFKTLGGVSAASLLMTLPRESQAAEIVGDRIQVAPLDSLAVGDIIEFNYPTADDSAFLTRLARPALGGVGEGDDIVAFLRACPHMGCHIQELNIQEAVLGPCGCHRSRFDLSKGGLQIVGRATQNLVQIELEEEEGLIIASGVLGLPYGHALETV